MKRIMHSAFCRVFCIMVWGIVLLSVAEAQATPNVFKSEPYGFSFNVPEGWTTGDASSIEGVDAWIYDERTTNGDYVTSFIVTVTDGEGMNKVTEAQLKKSYEANFKGVKILSFEKENFQGLPAIRVEHLHLKDGYLVRQLQYLMDRNGKGIILTFGAHNDNFEGHESDFKEILSSFKF